MFRFTCLLLILVPGWLDAQERSNFRTHAGISAMPIIDILGQAPGNEISGVAAVANFGSFINPRLSFGVNPYYATVTNVYTSISPYVERQQLTAFGLNAFLRGYFVSRPGFSAFMLASGGFGAMSEKITTTDPLSQHFNARVELLPLASFFAGPGVSWNFTPWFALEADVPVAILYFMEDYDTGRKFSTVLPTVGLQFYFGRSEGKKSEGSGNRVKP